MSDSKVEVENVSQERSIIHVELWNELLDRSGVLHDVEPVIFDGLKKTVGFVESTALQLEHILGFGSDKVSDDIARSGVVASIHELWGLHAFVSHEKMLKSFFIDGTNGFF